MNLTKEELIKLREQVQKITEPGEIEKVLESKTLYQRLKEVADRKPDFPALLYFGNTITYRQLLNLVDNAAKGFSEMGIGYNDVVTMSLLATPYGIVSLYALDKLGASMHMVNAASSIDELKRELSHFDSKYFIADDILCNKDVRSTLKECGVEKVVTTSLTDSIPVGFNTDKLKYKFVEKLKGINKKEYDGKNLVNFEQLLEMGRNSEKEEKACEFEPNRLVTVAYTSGSTGNSKAVMASWEKIDSMIQIMGMTETGRFDPDDVMFSTFPLWIYYSLINMIHEPLSLGVALALDPLFNPKDIAKRNEQYKFNHWLTIPPYVKAMMDQKKYVDCKNWKVVVTGGDVLQDNVKLAADEYIKNHGGTAHVEQGYGASEVLGSFSYGYNENPSLGSVGVPCVGNMVKVLDMETGEPLGVNQTGVGYLYTAARMDGYYGDEEATNHNLVKDENGVTWYNTEDLIHVNEKGEIFLDGRIRRIALTLDSKGNPAKIIPERTKKSISEVPNVMKCEVITIPDEEIVNKSVAFVVANENADLTNLKNNIMEYCNKNVPEYMVPKELYFIPDIPLKASKKPDLEALEQMYYSKKEEEQEKAGKRM